MDFPTGWTVIGLLVLLLGTGSQALGWTWETSQTSSLTACDGQPVSLDLRFTLNPGEVVQDMRWSRDLPSGLHQVIGLFVEGDFAATSGFAGRVTYQGNATIRLSDVTLSDTGVYTAEVSTHTGPDFDKITHSLNLTVKDDRQTLTISATQLSTAVYDPATKTYHVVLRCDVTAARLMPREIWVSWQSPSGVSLSSTSSDSSNGTFYLQLQNPVEGGNYVCLLNNNSNVCLADNLAGEAAVHVDEVGGRLTILEAKQADLEATNQVLVGQVAVLEDQTNTVVHFHAAFVSPTHLVTNSPLLFTHIHSNSGGGYSVSTGRFTAPVNGSYYFSFTTTAPNHIGSELTDNLEAYAYMVVDDQVVASARSKHQGYYNFAMAHTTRRLSVGQQVWLKSARDDQHFDSSYSSFTGFLIRADASSTRLVAGLQH